MKQRIINAAGYLWAKYGEEEVTLAAVASVLGVDVSEVQQYFPNDKALVLAAS